MGGIDREVAGATRKGGAVHASASAVQHRTNPTRGGCAPCDSLRLSLGSPELRAGEGRRGTLRGGGFSIVYRWIYMRRYNKAKDFFLFRE